MPSASSKPAEQVDGADHFADEDHGVQFEAVEKRLVAGPIEPGQHVDLERARLLPAGRRDA